MMSNGNDRKKSRPTANYSSAIAKAVAWLGDRYLLAKPINRSLSQTRILAPIRPSHGFK